jgi:Domain of unknown function (DUF4168)
MMRFHRTAQSLALALALGVAPLAALQAQTAQPQVQPSAPAPAADVSDQQVDAFTEAFLRATQVVQEWQPKVEGAEDADQQAELAQQASDEIAKAIEAEGDITINEYEGIILAMREDPQLARKVDDALRAKVGG